MTGRYEIDDQDREIFAECAALLLEHTGPQQGDWVLFADGVERRISHVWEWDGSPAESVQTSKGGSWHLGRYGASFSGSLFVGVKGDTLTDTGELRDGSCWIFHHDHAGAGRGVDSTVPFRVWRCSVSAPTY